MAPSKPAPALNTADRQRRSIALETLLRKNTRYDPKRAKSEKYYQKAKLLRSYHQLLKKEAPNQNSDGDAHDTAGPEIQQEQHSDDCDRCSSGDDETDEGAEVCKFYNKGKGCRAGASCPFKHQGTPARKFSLCKFFTSRTGCQKGAKCKFLHEGTPPAAPPAAPAAQKQSLMVKIWEQKQAEAEAARIAREKELTQKRDDARRRKQDRAQRSKNHLRRTASGQPVMKGIMSNLLSKIVKQNVSD